METGLKRFVSDRSSSEWAQSPGTNVKSIRIEPPQRVTKEQITAARIAVREANEAARKRRLQRGSNRA